MHEHSFGYLDNQGNPQLGLHKLQHCAVTCTVTKVHRPCTDMYILSTEEIFHISEKVLAPATLNTVNHCLYIINIHLVPVLILSFSYLTLRQ